MHLRKLEIIALFCTGIAVLLFILLKTYAFKFDVGDEWIYHYSALLTAEGNAPYRDFFLAHPPVSFLLAGILQKAFGFSIVFAKLIPILFACLTAGCVFLLSKKFSGLIGAFLAVIFLLFSYDYLRSSSHLTGVNITTFLLTLSVTLRIYNKPLAAGMLAIGAILTRLYAAPIALVLLLEQCVTNRQAGKRMGIGMMTMGFLIGVWILAVSGIQQPWEQLITYQVSKPAMSSSKFAEMLTQFGFHNFWILFLGSLGAGMALWQGISSLLLRRISTNEMNATVSFLIAPAALLHLFAVLQVKNLFYYYFIPALPLLAVLASVFILQTGDIAYRFVASERKRMRAAGLVIASLIVLLGTGLFLRENLHRDISYIQNQSGTSKTYTWRNPLLPSFIDSSIQKLFWKNPRNIGNRHTSINYYLWHESRYFESALPMANLVQSITGESDTIFGNSGTAPLIALLSGRRITNNEVDTNFMRFRSGLTSINDLIRSLSNTLPTVLIVQPRTGIDSFDEFKQFKNTYYELLQSFHDKTTNKTHEVWIQRILYTPK